MCVAVLLFEQLGALAGVMKISAPSCCIKSNQFVLVLNMGRGHADRLLDHMSVSREESVDRTEEGLHLRL